FDEVDPSVCRFGEEQALGAGPNDVDLTIRADAGKRAHDRVALVLAIAGCVRNLVRNFKRLAGIKGARKVDVALMLRLFAAVDVELGPGDVQIPPVRRILGHFCFDPRLVLVRLDTVEKLDHWYLSVPSNSIARAAGDNAAMGLFWPRLAYAAEGDEGMNGQA